MPVESAADRATFLSADEFGVTATYTPAAGGDSSEIEGIFDATHMTVDLSGGVPVSSNNPVFHCRSADLTDGGAENDTLVINGVTYKVRDPQPDGTGMTMLELQKQ